MSDPIPTSEQPTVPPCSPSDVAGLSRTEVLDLVRTSQRRAWQRGERPLIEDYLQRLPALQAHPDAVLDLLHAEAALREETGEAVTVEEYRHRFPQHADSLDRYFAVRRAVADSFLRSVLPSSQAAAEAETVPPAAPPPLEPGGTAVQTP